jgi:hypothetical protein
LRLTIVEWAGCMSPAANQALGCRRDIGTMFAGAGSFASIPASAADHLSSPIRFSATYRSFAETTIDANVRKHTLALELARLDELQEVFYARPLRGTCGALR